MNIEITCSVCSEVIGYSTSVLHEPVVCLLCGKPDDEEDSDLEDEDVDSIEEDEKEKD